MGSIIEVFPRRKPDSRAIAARWRSTTPSQAAGLVRVRATRVEDYAPIRALQRLSGPSVAPLTLKQFESQRHAFPEGQAVAVCGGEVVGAVSSLVLSWDEYALEHSWSTVTGDGFFTTHDPAGRTLYGAQFVVDATRRGFGVGRALHQWQRRLCRKLNLRRIISAAALPGYGAAKEEMSAELYAQRVIWGDIVEPGLNFLLSQGFHYCGIVRDYLPEDLDSCGNAALVAWLNPLFAPAEPPANIDRERRKCA